MKGLMFTEFIEWVEETWSPDLSDRMLDRCPRLTNGGAYTAVGTYPHEDMLELFGALSAETDQPASDLVKSFGRAAFASLARAHPKTVGTLTSSFQVLSSLEQHIHPEVRKLYPDAEVPNFEAFEQGGILELTYRSSRPFADLAEGLIEGCGTWFEELLHIDRRENLDGSTTFMIRRIDG